MIKLLLVEDDANIRYILQSGLQDIIGGYEVITATNGAEGLNAWKEHRPDIIISDIDMPVMNGFEMVERIREIDGDIPILFTSALTSPKDVRAGYGTGGNSYIKKPFVADELDAHIHAVIRMKRGAKARVETGHYKLGRYTLDAKHATLRDNTTEKVTLLTVRATEVLQLLAENKNEIVTRDAILDRLWNIEGDYFASRSLDVFMAKLRKQLAGEPRVELKTVRGVGIMLIIDE